MLEDLPLFPAQASTIAGDIDLLYFFICAICVIFGGMIFVACIALPIMYPRRSDDDRPAEIHGNTTLEIAWSIPPFVVSMVLFGWGGWLFFEMATPPRDAMTYYAVGKQWMWKVQHPTGHREINDLHIPVNKPIRIVMTSEDVLHDYYIPAFRVKKDVVPGRYTDLWFEATQTGEFHLFCAEYCGTEHSLMVGTVYVMDQDDYDAWLIATAEEETPAEAGERLFFAKRCNTCHMEGRGPSLEGVFGRQVRLSDGTMARADEGYIREAILHPGSQVVENFDRIMPTFQGQFSEEEVLEIMAYLKTLNERMGKEVTAE